MKVAIRIILVVYLFCCLIFSIYQNYQYTRDIDAVIDRAQISASAEDMLKYVQKLKINMENLGAIRGHTKLIFKTDMTDLAQHYLVVQNLIKRLDEIQGMPIDGVEYQVALDDLRGTIREFPNFAGALYWINYGWILLVFAIFLILFNGAIKLASQKSSVSHLKTKRGNL